MRKQNSFICLFLLMFAGCCNCSCNTDTEPVPVDPEKKITLPVDGYLVLLDDPSDRSLETSIIISSQFWLRDIKSHGYNQPLIHDSRSDRGKELVEASKKSALPLMIFCNSQGVVLAASPVPKTINGVKRLLNGGI